MTLPLDSLTIRLATPNEAVETSRRSYAEWGRGMTLEEYLERDGIMGTLDFAAGGKLKIW